MLSLTHTQADTINCNKNVLHSSLSFSFTLYVCVCECLSICVRVCECLRCVKSLVIDTLPLRKL